MRMNETKCPNCGWSKTYEIDKSNSYDLLIEVSNENERLAQQLQSYRQKEDKIREYCKELNLASVSEDIEEILNEGDK